jgi:outer membrane protein assembly factor BamB
MGVGKDVAVGRARGAWLSVFGVIAVGLISLAPAMADAAVLKRVHSGTTTLSADAAVTVPLELADASKAFVVCSFRGTGQNASQRAVCLLSNNLLTIDPQAKISTIGTVIVSWYVAEFESGVSVQRGTVSFAAAATTPTTPPTLSPSVDCSKSFVIMSEGTLGNYTGNAASSADEWYLHRGILGTFASPCAVTAGTTTTTLSIARIDTTTTANGAWQVVTMDGATVLARGVSTILGATSATVTPSPAMAADPTKAFVIMSKTAGASVAGVEAKYQTRGDLANCSTTCTQVTFTRVSNVSTAGHNVDLAYEVVQLSDGSTVQRGNVASTTTGTTLNSAALTAIDRSATVPFFTESGGSATNDTTNTRLVDTSWTSAFTSTTQLQFTRASTPAVVSTVNYFVVQFYKCLNSRLCSVGATGGNATATISWSPIYDTQCVVNSKQSACEAIVFRDTSAITWTPSNQAYTVGATPGGTAPASMRTVFVGSTGTANAALQSFTDTVSTPSLVNGTRYYYRVFGKVNGSNTYITDIAQSVSQVDVTPSASFAWSYATTGGSTLNAPVAGNGELYVASNGNKIVTLNSSTGAEVATAEPTYGAVQSYVAWFPVSGGASEAVVSGDQAGWLTSVDATTGVRNWTIKLPVDSGGFIQAAVAVQLSAYATCDSNAFTGAYGGKDVIYIASRDSSQTANNVYAVQADTGTVLWTYTAPASMDRAAGQPFIDYCRNRLWVSTGNGAGSNQSSLWVINTLNGNHITSFGSVGNQTSSAPTLSGNGTVYVGDAAGKVYAFNASTTGTSAKYAALQLAGTSPSVSGFMWEDWSTQGRLYVPVVTNGRAGIWCVQDSGSAMAGCSNWPTNPQTLSSASPAVTCTAAEPLVTGTAIFFPCTTSTNNAVIYQINTTDGALYQGTGRPLTVETTASLGGISTEDLTQLYVGTSTGRTYRINLSSGNLP